MPVMKLMLQVSEQKKDFLMYVFPFKTVILYLQFFFTVIFFFSVAMVKATSCATEESMFDSWKGMIFLLHPQRPNRLWNSPSQGRP